MKQTQTDLQLKHSTPGLLVLITGGTRGLGKHLAERLLESGATVITTSRTFEFSGSIEIKDSSLTTQHLDVTCEHSVKQLFEWIASQNKSINVLINNAGIGVFKSLVDTSSEEWNQIITTNLTGLFLCSKEAFKSMKKIGGGRIINIGSIADRIPLLNNSAYTASKSGARGLADVINEEGKFEKIRVTHISLGAVYTEIWQNREGFKKEDMLDPNLVAEYIAHIAQLPLNIRINHVDITPEKGVL